MITPNSELVKNINTAIYGGITNTRITNALDGIPMSTFVYWKDTQVIPIKKLIDICNHFQISIRPFILFNEEKENLIKLDLVEDFKPISIDFIKMGLMMTKGNHMPISSVCSKLGISTRRWYRVFVDRETAVGSVNLNEYLQWCNTFKYHPMMFLYDDNCTWPKVEGYKDDISTTEMETVFKDKGVNIKSLKEDVETLKQMVSGLISSTTPPHSETPVDDTKTYNDHLNIFADWIVNNINVIYAENLLKGGESMKEYIVNSLKK